MKSLGGLGYLLILSTHLCASLEQGLQELHRSLLSLHNTLAQKSLSQKPQVQEHNFSEMNVKTVIVIDNIVKEFSTKTPCEVSEWANKLENSCKCCLIQNALELTKGKKPSAILEECIRKNNCSTEVMDQLFGSEGITEEYKEEAIRKLITALYDKAIIVKRIEPINIEFTRDGSFTEQSLVNFLARAHKEKKLIHDDFRDVSCLTAKNLIKEKGSGTAQLFLITSRCSGKPVDYILKGLAKGTREVINLEKSFLVPDLVPYLYPNYVPGFPSFVLPIAYMFYQYNGKEHYVSLMPKAPGIPMNPLILRYKTSILTNKEDQAYLTKIYFDIGRSMANFHRKFMDNFKDLAKPGVILNPTYVHGDAHQGNMFYDDHLIFIDNEGIDRFSPQGPFLDIESFIFSTALSSFYSNVYSSPINLIFLTTWLRMCIGSFLLGYIRAYDAELQNRVLEELIALFSNQANYHHKAWYQYYKAYENIFKDIFKSLRNAVEKS